ncbi:hypothetical protein E4T56_gene9567 [Termitomyces sp. T112]|nr:hypothetical protein E4T56_gene9567 [Termitomyces sp. T112]
MPVPRPETTPHVAREAHHHHPPHAHAHHQRGGKRPDQTIKKDPQRGRGRNAGPVPAEMELQGHDHHAGRGTHAGGNQQGQEGDRRDQKGGMKTPRAHARASRPRPIIAALMSISRVQPFGPAQHPLPFGRAPGQTALARNVGDGHPARLLDRADRAIERRAIHHQLRGQLVQHNRPGALDIAHQGKLGGGQPMGRKRRVIEPVERTGRLAQAGAGAGGRGDG